MYILQQPELMQKTELNEGKRYIDVCEKIHLQN